MIRPFTVVCMLMAVGSGLYLYQCKHQAQVLDREIARTIKQTEAARDRIGMLRAEWAQLNEPERIAELARAHSSLQTAKPTQFLAANDLAGKLPAPAVATRQPQSTDAEDDTEAARPVAQPPAPAPRAVTPAPDPKPIARAPVAVDPKPVQTASPAAAADPKPAHHTATAAAVPPPPQAVARPVAPPRAVTQIPVNADATAPGTVGAAVLRAQRAHEVAPVTPAPPIHPAVAPAASLPAPIPQPMPPAATSQAYAAPAGGSMLGGSRSSLPPPVPFAAR